MLKLLIQLQITKKRRNFKWKNFFLATYFYALIAIVFVSSLAGAGDEVWKMLAELKWESIVPVIASMMLLPDMIMKLIFKSDSAIMDAYIKSRPVNKRTWIRFVAITHLADFWTMAWALPAAIGCFFAMPFGTALASALLLLSVSYTNSLAIVALRTAQGWEWKSAVIVGWIMWSPLAFIHGLNLFGMSWGIHIAYFFVLIAIALYLEFYYLGYLRSYDENKRKQKKVSKSRRSAFFIEMRPFLRGKRLRMFAIFPILFIAQTFWYASIGYEEPDTINGNVLIPLAIMMLPIMALQLTFALEGNYFDGLWTRPISVEQLLLRKYYTAIPLALCSFSLLLPTYFLYNTNLLILLGSLFFSVGVTNLIMLTYCFHTKAMDIFASGFMNTQGTDFSASNFAIVFTVTLGPILLIAAFPINVCGLLFGVLGIVGFAVHRYAIAWIARRYEAKRYKHFERYKNK